MHIKPGLNFQTHISILDSTNYLQKDNMLTLIPNWVSFVVVAMCLWK